MLTPEDSRKSGVNDVSDAFTGKITANTKIMPTSYNFIFLNHVFAFTIGGGGSPVVKDLSGPQ